MVPANALTEAGDEESRYTAWVSPFYRGPASPWRGGYRRRAKGTYYYSTMIADIYSRKIVGWEAFLGQSVVNSRVVIRRAVSAKNRVDRHRNESTKILKETAIPPIGGGRGPISRIRTGSWL